MAEPSTVQPTESTHGAPDYRVIAIDPTIAEHVRTNAVAPGYGHPTHTEVSTGYGPCRLCLGRFDEGRDRRILFTFDPFEGLETLPLPGPVFIHEDGCATYPVDAGFPEPLRDLPLTLNAYARGRRLVAQEYIHGDAIEEAVHRLFELPEADQPEVEYIHVRNTEAGCYICRIQR